MPVPCARCSCVCDVCVCRCSLWPANSAKWLLCTDTVIGDRAHSCATLYLEQMGGHTHTHKQSHSRQQMAKQSDMTCLNSCITFVVCVVCVCVAHNILYVFAVNFHKLMEKRFSLLCKLSQQTAADKLCGALHSSVTSKIIKF